MTLRKREIFLSITFLMVLSLVMVCYYDTFSWKVRVVGTLDIIKSLAATLEQESKNSLPSQNTVEISSNRENGSKASPDMKIILFYTPFGSVPLPWPHTIGREKNLTDFSNRPCKVSSCQFSISKDDISKSHVVIFHGYSTPSPEDMKALVLKKPKNQMWAWFNEESPAHTANYQFKKLNNLFELTITHMQESDIHTLYGEYFKLEDNARAVAEKKNANENFAKGKDRLVIWLASNCVSLRLNIVKAIAKHIKVDVFGRCQKYFSKQSGSCSRSNRECQKITEKYKFFLSLENSNCRGYLTEKYWKNALDRNVVPIVIAGSYNKDVLIPGSYIDILDFPNALALTNYLKYLDKNETAYNQYFEWKKKYRYTTETNWICDLCEYLHRNETKKSFWNMKKFYGAEENCFADDSRIRNVWLESNSLFQNVIFFFITFMMVLTLIMAYYYNPFSWRARAVRALQIFIL